MLILSRFRHENQALNEEIYCIMNKFLVVIGVCFAFLLHLNLSAKTFELDKDHTSVTFKIRHLLSNLQGRFTDFHGTFETDDKTGALVKVTAFVAAKSINTNNEKRDTHLRSADFFDAEKIPELKFVSDKFTIQKGQKGKMPGQMTIHGVTKPVVWEVEFHGEAKDPWGNDKGAFSATIETINRKDFGLTWNKALETGGVLVGDEVKIEVDVEGNAKAADVKAKPAGK